MTGAPPGGIEWRGSVRSRLEVWDWFEGAADNAYAFSGNSIRLRLDRKHALWDWSMELAAPLLLGLPDNAAAPLPQGVFGMGANYFVDNARRRNAGMVFLKNFFVTLHRRGAQGHSLQLGRLEFAEGAEMTPKNPTLATLKNTRIRERLIGTFGFTHAGRSFDGLHYGYQSEWGRLTVLAAAPTRGVFQTDGWGWTRTGVGYVAWTRPLTMGRSAGELRLFAIQYHDWRRLPKTDNRSAPERRTDLGNLRISTIGGHYVQAGPVRGGAADLLVWGAWQTGRWGRLDHAAWAIALEGGHQPRVLARLKPWIRAGVFASSGDADPGDSRHRTFFQILPTPRLYARFPFFNLMNLEDGFVELVLRPHGKVTLRPSLHGLRLRERQDLWYAGGGAYNPWSFGYAGRPSQGARSLATLYDFGADLSLTGPFSVGAYFGVAKGKSVIAAIYPERARGSLFFLEATYRF